MVTLDGVVKLTDFGLARIYDFYTLLTSVVVTLWYRSPEVLMGMKHALKIIVFKQKFREIAQLCSCTNIFYNNKYFFVKSKFKNKLVILLDRILTQIKYFFLFPLGLSYATPVDIWACGCILAELGTRKPLFDGKCERNQLSKIFEVLGTPDDENWPENAAVLKSNFVCMPKKAFCDVLPGLDPLADDLLEVSFALKMGGWLL